MSLKPYPYLKWVNVLLPLMGTFCFPFVPVQADCIPVPPEKAEEESDLSDILSSDSDESSLDELRAQMEEEQKQDNERGRKVRKATARDEELERMFFYSIYVDIMPVKEKETVIAQKSEGFDSDQVLDESTKAVLHAENSKYVLDEIDEEKFNEILKTYINEDEGIEEIDGNISIQTLAERNFKTLRMDGPSRRIALLFSYQPGDRPISFSFLHFMQLQKERNPFISGVLLYYESGLGIHIVEGSEYVLLMHFPLFFKSESYKKLIKCKVLAVEDLSSMKYFEQYSCYKGFPPPSTIDLPEKVDDFSTSIQYIKQIGAGLGVFLNHAYRDSPSVTEDNILPEPLDNLLPPSDLLRFALEDKRWTPGLQDVKLWFNHLTSLPGETDNAEFVWPIRSDLLPVNIFHPASGEEEMLMTDLSRKIKESKLEGTLSGEQNVRAN